MRIIDENDDNCRRGPQRVKQWLDSLFLSKQIKGNLVEDQRGQRFYGLYDQMKCPEVSKFIQTLEGYNWAPAAQYNAGTLFTASGNKSTLTFTNQVVGPFKGQ